METERHYCKYIIHKSIRHYLIYYESKSCILYMNIVYAFIIIDLICERCMEPERHYCKINENAFITISIHMYLACFYYV